MSDLLLHVCCAPCMVYPYRMLREKYDVHAYFYNPNIHPFREYQARKECLTAYCAREEIACTVHEKYGLKDFLQRVVFHEDERCGHCYQMRMQETARFAQENGFRRFSTTLLYSRYQNHRQIVEIGQQEAAAHNLDFYYEDFRTGWQWGIDESKKQEMYRQAYCGCIYSEQERYDTSLRKKG